MFKKALLFSLFCVGSVYADSKTFTYMDRIVQSGNIRKLETTLQYGYSLEETNDNGDTVLCKAVWRKDHRGYELLKLAGANLKPKCLEKDKDAYNAFMKEQPKDGTYYQVIEKETAKAAPIVVANTYPNKWLWFNVLLAGGVGAAVIGSGGGGGSGGSSPNITPSDPRYPGIPVDGYENKNMFIPDSPITPSANDVKSIVDCSTNPKFCGIGGGFTSEYGNGALAQINAQYAYARGYNGLTVERYDENNEYAPVTPTTTPSSKITVAVVDTGIAPVTGLNLTTGGINMDYGPYIKGTNTKGYYFSNGHIYLTNSDTPIVDANNAPLTISPDDSSTLQYIGPSTQAEWEAYTARYAVGYVWNVNNTTPYGYTTSGEQGNHGTHVAGIIGADIDPQDNVSYGTQLNYAMQGVNPNAILYPVRYDPWRNFTKEEIHSILEAGAKVVNYSINMEGYFANEYPEYLTSALSQGNGIEALQNAFLNNLIVVISAGNTGTAQSNLLSAIPLSDLYNGSNESIVHITTDDLGHTVVSTDTALPTATVDSTGLFVNVVSVDKNAYNEGDNYVLSSFSNACGVTANYCIAAPGGNGDDYMISTGALGSFIGMQGTSMATPVVSGAISLLMAAFPYMEPQEIVSILFETATDLGIPGVDTTYGHGLLNLEAATRPTGSPNLVTELGTLLSVSNTSASLPTSFNLRAFNQVATMLDSHQRAFDINLTSFVKNSGRSKQAFADELRTMTLGNKQYKLPVNEKFSMAFSAPNANLAYKDGYLQAGTMDMDLNADKLSFGFKYSQDTILSRGDEIDQNLANPFSKLRNAYEVNLGYKIFDKLSFNSRISVGENGFYDGYDKSYYIEKDASTVELGLNYAPVDTLNLGFNIGQLSEQGALLGFTGSEIFNTKDYDTTYYSAYISLNPTKKWNIRASYHYGLSNSSGNLNGLMGLTDLTSDSFAIDTNYQITDNHLMGLSLSSPIRIKSGNANFNLPVALAGTNQIYYQRTSASLTPEAREMDLDFYFHRTTDKTTTKFLIGPRFNPDHNNAQTDWRVMMSFGINY